MRGAILPAALLCVAWALMLAFAPRRAIAPSVAVLIVAALLAGLAPVSGRYVEFAFLGCWASLILIGLSIHLPRGVPLPLALLGSLLCGLFAGLVVAGEGTYRDLAIALPFGLGVFLARWIVAKGWQIALKVVSSWLIAVALLAAMLPTTPMPGYTPDHMD